MGQQQMLLLVFGIVAMALASVLGIQAFNAGFKKANADSIVEEGLTIAAEIQAWRQRPVAMNGGKGASLSGFSISEIGFATNGDGEYEGSSANFEASSSSGTIIVQGDNTETDNRVAIVINGQGSVCLSTKITHTADDTTLPGSTHPTCNGF